ncbi:MAG TPA: inositol monophosphatase family protein, partial [Verrucomicrobiae bacterium]|nr:inositol monophosphatase family protein [Verrucomicrobiae bacterium]
MNAKELKRALTAATTAAQAAGQLLRQNLRETKKINASFRHDLKLELDVRCQELIERQLRAAFPDAGFLGEEDLARNIENEHRWVVDPIDGTVNFAYGIPHSCVSIALQQRLPAPVAPVLQHKHDEVSPAFETIVGVVYDPFCDELWTAIQGQPARLNNRVIHVSNRAKLGEAIIAMGFSKSESILREMLPSFTRLARRVRKVRMMGAAALDMVYVATGRMDAYFEVGVRLWDIAAGGLILECAGGEFWRQPIKGDHRFQVIATNG